MLQESPQEELPILSTQIVPELASRLREAGLLTAIVTLESPRFKHYLKKPANLLHDRWIYLERGVDRSVLYRLGTQRSLRQDLTIKPGQGVALLETHDPRSGRSQAIEFDMRSRRVISNIVTFDYEEGPANYNYFSLHRHKGYLKEIPAEKPIEEPTPEPSQLVAECVFA